MKKILFWGIILISLLLNSCWWLGSHRFDVKFYFLLPNDIERTDIYIQFDDHDYWWNGDNIELVNDNDYENDFFYKNFNDSNFIKSVDESKNIYLINFTIGPLDPPNSQIEYDFNIIINKDEKDYNYHTKIRLQNYDDGYVEGEIIPGDDSGIDIIKILFYHELHSSL